MHWHAGILATLAHCIDLMQQREEAWRRRVEKETERRRKAEEAYRAVRARLQQHAGAPNGNGSSQAGGRFDTFRCFASLCLFRFAFSFHSHRPGVCRRREGEGEGVETKGPTFGKCLPSSIIHVFVRTWAPPILYPVADPLPTILGTLNTLLSFILAQRTAILLRFCSSTFLLFVSFRSIFVRMHSASCLHYSILI